MQGRVFVGSEDAGAVRGTRGMQGRVFVGSEDADAVRGTRGMQERVFVGSEDAGAVRGTQGMQEIQAVEPTSSRLRLVDFIKIIRENGVDEATASDEDVELAFSKHASMGTGKL
jgi:hypothetical protein